MLHFLESYPRIILRIIPANHTTNHTHGFEAMFWSMRDIIMALASRDDLCFVALSLVCMSIYLPVGHVFLGMEGAKAVRQCHQNDLVHKMCIFLFCIWQSSVLLLYFCRNSLLPESYCESYPIHTPNHTQTSLCCAMAQSAPSENNPSPAWCRREPFDIGYSIVFM